MCDFLEVEMFLSLIERNVSLYPYNGFVVRRVDLKVNFENCDVMLFMARCYLRELKCCDEKICVDEVLSMVRVIVLNEVLLGENELPCDYIQCGIKL